MSRLTHLFGLTLSRWSRDTCSTSSPSSVYKWTSPLQLPSRSEIGPHDSCLMPDPPDSHNIASVVQDPASWQNDLDLVHIWSVSSSAKLSFIKSPWINSRRRSCNSENTCLPSLTCMTYRDHMWGTVAASLPRRKDWKRRKQQKKKKKKGKGSGETSFQKRGKKRNVPSSLWFHQDKERKRVAGNRVFESQFTCMRIC